MNRLLILPAVVLGLALTAPAAISLDRIVAVVDTQIILESELNEIALFAFQRSGKAVAFNSPEFAEFKRQVLETMIEDKLLLKQAEADSILISPDDVARQRDAQIEEYVRKLGSRSALEEELRRSYGTTLARFRKELEGQIRDQMIKGRLAEALRQKNLPSREDVEKFFREYKDSLPTEKKSIRLAHIMREIAASAEVETRAKTRIRAAEDELNAGKPFEDVAARYSADSASAKQGGDLGWFGKGLLDVNFEKAAFALGAGEVGRVVRTASGYHLIKVTDRRENEIRARHIFIPVRPETADTLRARTLLDSLRTALSSDSAFAAAAARFSDDKLTRSRGGDLGWISETSLNDEYRKAVEGLGKGTNSEPIAIRSAFHLFRVLDRNDERPLTLADDYDILRNLAENDKIKKALKTLTERLRKRVFIENRLESAAGKPK